MTNWEKYKDKILKFSSAGGFAKIGDELAYCVKVDCKDCQFRNKEGCCDEIKAEWLAEWLDEEYKEPSHYDGWQIGDKIEVSDDGKNWIRRHFAGVNKNGKPLVWVNGTTSWSNPSGAKEHWNYARKVGPNDN